MSLAAVLDLAAASTAEALERVVAALRGGGMVVLPTETVYGLAARVPDRGRLDALKGARRSPYALAVPDRDAAEREAPLPAGPAERAAARWWPGPVTLVVPSPAGGTVGLRVPGHPFTRQLLSRLGEPLLLTSANASGEPAPRTVGELSAAVRGRVGLIVDAGACALGEASTVLACGPAALAIRREGVVRRSEVIQRAQAQILVVCSGNTCRSPMAASLLEHSFQGLAAEDPGFIAPRVRSAGLHARQGLPASDGALDALAALDLDLAPHRSEAVVPEILHDTDLVLAMTADQLDEFRERHPRFHDRSRLFDVDGGDVRDPFGGSPAVYRDCASMLAAMAGARARSLLPPA